MHKLAINCIRQLAIGWGPHPDVQPILCWGWARRFHSVATAAVRVGGASAMFWSSEKRNGAVYPRINIWWIWSVLFFHPFLTREFFFVFLRSDYDMMYLVPVAQAISNPCGAGLPTWFFPQSLGDFAMVGLGCVTCPPFSIAQKPGFPAFFWWLSRSIFLKAEKPLRIGFFGNTIVICVDVASLHFRSQSYSDGLYIIVHASTSSTSWLWLQMWAFLQMCRLFWQWVWSDYGCMCNEVYEVCQLGRIHLRPVR